MYVNLLLSTYINYFFDINVLVKNVIKVTVLIQINKIFEINLNNFKYIDIDYDE